MSETLVNATCAVSAFFHCSGMVELFGRILERRIAVVTAFVLLLISAVLSFLDFELLALWPSFVALVVVFTMRSAFVGLLAGALAGAILLSGGQLIQVFSILWSDQFWPIFSSEWKLSAILFTLILGGFVALLEAGGGLQGLLHKILGAGRRSARRMQLAVGGFGLMVFFDGLANTMLVGRLLRSAADRCGVSREKLAYLADATGSAVACLAFISTWIAFQLAMIREGFAIAGEEVNAYGLFLKSLPTNFYCWFALVMVLVSILRDFNPGPMRKVEGEARARNQRGAEVTEATRGAVNHLGLAVVPTALLILSIPVLSYLIGTDSVFPFSLEKFAEAYAVAETHVPEILVASSILAALVAGLTFRLSGLARSEGSARRPSHVFVSGVRDLSGPVLILLAAWMLGSAISQLGAADMLGGLLKGNIPLALVPLAVFVTGALISFSTGTSWGTMGVLMPLAIPVIFVLTGESPGVLREEMIVAAIGAVFSGAVFGDHCSPFSDTTIVSSVAAGVEPLDHVRTQMPFALITASVAGILGFIPLGLGLSPFISLAVGTGVLFGLPSVFKTAKL